MQLRFCLINVKSCGMVHATYAAMAELLRTNQLKPVYHGEPGIRRLKELGRSYLGLCIGSKPCIAAGPFPAVVLRFTLPVIAEKGWPRSWNQECECEPSICISNSTTCNPSASKH